MSLQCGIVGLPNVGKSTLFNCLSSTKAQSANFPFCTIEPNVAIIPVPDERIVELGRLCQPQRGIIPATVEIVDIAGLVKGASKGEGLGNKFLANIRETDAIIHVLRCFDNPNVVHIDNLVDPIRDKEIVDLELQLKDLETVENMIVKKEKQAKAGKDRSAAVAMNVLQQYKDHLLKGYNARDLVFDSDEESEFARSLFLLTNKPILYVCNVDDEAIRQGGNEYVRRVKDEIKDAEIIALSVQTESEIAELEEEEDKKQFLAELGLVESGADRLIKSAYRLLNLRTFLTAGKDEVRAWTFCDGWTAPQCAGVIHSDFERGFICAEVIKYDDYIANGGEMGCKNLGKMHIEGKEYRVQDGDIIHFLFNV